MLTAAGSAFLMERPNLFFLICGRKSYATLSVPPLLLSTVLIGVSGWKLHKLIGIN